MAFFKFRKSSDEAASAPNPAPSVEALRRRARHRLIGATVLVLLGVVGFPLLVDKHPRPIAVDIPIEIPDRNKVKPLAVGSVAPAPLTSAPATAAPVTAVPAPAATVPPTPAAMPVAPASSTPPFSGTASSPVAAPAVRSPEPASAKPVKPAEPARTDSGQKAQALLEGRAAPAGSAAASAPAASNTDATAAGAQDRFVVQVGAFADAAKARETRLKLERAGLKTYAQVVDTKEGKRTRVRVGPFATKAEAEKAADKIKSLDLPAALLTL